MKRVAVIPGHGPTRPDVADPGACGPEGCESDWTWSLAERVAQNLRRRGLEAGVVELGTSRQRTSHAESGGAELCLYLHGDVGTPAVYWFPGSTGETAARAVHEALQTRTLSLPWRVGCRAANQADVPRAHALLAQARGLSVLVELVDMRDGAAVSWLLREIDLVADLIAAGVQAWAG